MTLHTTVLFFRIQPSAEVVVFPHGCVGHLFYHFVYTISEDSVWYDVVITLLLLLLLLVLLVLIHAATPYPILLNTGFFSFS